MLQEKPSALKRDIQPFKTWNFLLPFFLWVIFALPDPDPATQLMRFRIQNPEPCLMYFTYIYISFHIYCIN